MPLKHVFDLLSGKTPVAETVVAVVMDIINNLLAPKEEEEDDDDEEHVSKDISPILPFPVSTESLKGFLGSVNAAFKWQSFLPYTKMTQF